MSLPADYVFRKYNVDGDPSSGYHYPKPSELLDWATGVDQIAIQAGNARDAAITAKNTAEGYASTAVAQGNVPIHSSRTSAAALEIPSALDVIWVNGYSSSGDGGGAYYRHAATEPDHPGKFQDADDQWWQIYMRMVNPFMFGGVPGAATDSITALRACLNYCKASIEDDNRRRMVLDLAGERWSISDTLNFNERVDYLTVQNGAIKALDVSWADVDTSMNTYYDTYQTVTQAQSGETWTLRKPLIKCAGSNPGLTFDRVDLDGDRKAAGILSEDSAQERRFQNGRIQNCRSYSVHMDGPMDMVNCDVRPAVSNTGDRDAYGITIDTSGVRLINVRARWAHCLLLTTGGENIMTGCDFENGETDASGDLPTILWENRAPDNAWNGGRLRNGQVRTWSTRMAITDATCGNEDEQYWKNFIRLYASSANTELTGFVFQPANVPTEMVDGSTYWFNFTTTGQGSWKIDTTNISLVKGYPSFCGGAWRFLTTEEGNTVAIFRGNTTETARIKLANNKVLDSEAPWVGGDGGSLILGSGNSRNWIADADGDLKPNTAGGGTVGSEDLPVYRLLTVNATSIVSDGRWKEVRPLTDEELDAALTIRSIAYYSLDDAGVRIPKGDLHFGVVAQDVVQAFGGLEKALDLGVVLQNSSGRLSVCYTELDQIRIEAHARERERLSSLVLSLQDRIEQLEAK